MGAKKFFLVVLAALSLSWGAATLAQTPDKVLGRWTDGWYVGTVIGRQGNQFKILFDDGDEALVPASGVRPLDWGAGTRLQCNWKGGGRYYWGVITAKSGGRITIRYDDAMEETTVIGRCRTPL